MPNNDGHPLRILQSAAPRAEPQQQLAGRLGGHADRHPLRTRTTLHQPHHPQGTVPDTRAALPRCQLSFRRRLSSHSPSPQGVPDDGEARRGRHMQWCPLVIFSFHVPQGTNTDGEAKRGRHMQSRLLDYHSLPHLIRAHIMMKKPGGGTTCSGSPYDTIQKYIYDYNIA